MTTISSAVYRAAKQHGTVAGDAYFEKYSDAYYICSIADGLGSGEMAQQSAAVMPIIIEQYGDESVERLMQRCNTALKGKRGAAIAIAKVHYAEQQIEYSSIGNVQMYMVNENDKLIYPIPQAGFLSGRRQVVKTDRISYQAVSRFFMHSDGITIRRPGELLKNNSSADAIIQAVIPTVDFKDDATMIAVELT
ncbi:MAG TPA: PP2C family serine/threonine-protein phosphatase [Metalysinibacillus sp.]